MIHSIQYSKELVSELQKYWKEKFDEEITENVANQYLDSLADLYTCLTESIKQSDKAQQRATGAR